MALDNGIDIGDVVLLVRRFKTLAGDPFEPDTVHLIVTRPDKTTEEVATHPVTDEDELADCALVLKVPGEAAPDLGDGTGVHAVLLPIDQSGIWFCEWSGTGTLASAETDYFLVRRRRVGTVGS
jgi:hypothetical protein